MLDIATAERALPGFLAFEAAVNLWTFRQRRENLSPLLMKYEDWPGRLLERSFAALHPMSRYIKCFRIELNILHVVNVNFAVSIRSAASLLSPSIMLRSFPDESTAS